LSAEPQFNLFRRTAANRAPSSHFFVDTIRCALWICSKPAKGGARAPSLPKLLSGRAHQASKIARESLAVAVEDDFGSLAAHVYHRSGKFVVGVIFIIMAEFDLSIYNFSHDISPSEPS
jgi:hypothetical protein